METLVPDGICFRDVDLRMALYHCGITVELRSRGLSFVKIMSERKAIEYQE